MASILVNMHVKVTSTRSSANASQKNYVITFSKYQHNTHVQYTMLQFITAYMHLYVYVCGSHSGQEIKGNR